MFDTVIRRGAIVDRSILDKEVVVGPGAIVGDGGDDTPNRREPTRLNTGISVIGKRAVIPRGAKIGRNVKVAESVRSIDFTRKVIPSGGSVDRVDDRSARRSRPGSRADERTVDGATVARTAEVAVSSRARD